MKTNITGKQQPTHPQTQSSKRTENKNVLDSREGEEQSDKGDDTTHNKKEKHSKSKTKNKND
jgi:hypothetical protein